MSQADPGAGDRRPREEQRPKRHIRTLYLPNSSPVPNWFFDEVLSDKRVPHAARSVLLFMLRKTVGWDNRHEDLSLAEIQAGAAVTRPTAIHAVRVICDCWGLFKKTRGRKGQYCSTYTIGDPSAEGFFDRYYLTSDIYGSGFPDAKQLRIKPCTQELLAAQRAKNAAEEARREARHGAG